MLDLSIFSVLQLDEVYIVSGEHERNFRAFRERLDRVVSVTVIDFGENIRGDRPEFLVYSEGKTHRRASIINERMQ